MTAEKPKTSIKTVIILSIILLFAGIFYFSIKTQNPALQGKMRDVPVFAMPALLENQGFVTTKDITTDAPVLVSIWASWCIPCRNEHKVLKHISDKYGIKIIGINFKDSVQNGRDFIKEYGNPFYKIGSDEAGNLSLMWGLGGVPETFVINKHGKIVYKHQGELTQENLPEFLNILKENGFPLK